MLNHHPVVSFCDAPVVDYYESNGRMIPIACAGNYGEAVRKMRLVTTSTLPQIDITTQGAFTSKPPVKMHKNTATT